MFSFLRRKGPPRLKPPEPLEGVLTGEQWQQLKQGAAVKINGWMVYMHFVDSVMPYLVVHNTSTIHCLYGPGGFTKWVHIYAWLQILVRDPQYFEELRKTYKSKCMELTI